MVQDFVHQQHPGTQCIFELRIFLFPFGGILDRFLEGTGGNKRGGWIGRICSLMFSYVFFLKNESAFASLKNHTGLKPPLVLPPLSPHTAHTVLVLSLKTNLSEMPLERFLHADDAQGIMDELMQQQPYIWHLGMIRCCDGISCKDGCKI